MAATTEREPQDGLDETPKLRRLYNYVQPIRDAVPELWHAVHRLAHYVARLSLPELFEGDVPFGEDYKTELLTSRMGRLASINVRAGVALQSCIDADYSRALDVARDIVAEHVTRAKKPLTTAL